MRKFWRQTNVTQNCMSFQLHWIGSRSITTHNWFDKIATIWLLNCITSVYSRAWCYCHLWGTQHESFHRKAGVLIRSSGTGSLTLFFLQSYWEWHPFDNQYSSQRLWHVCQRNWGRPVILEWTPSWCCDYWWCHNSITRHQTSVLL